jgi:hypothetical protein
MFFTGRHQRGSLRSASIDPGQPPLRIGQRMRAMIGPVPSP